MFTAKDKMQANALTGVNLPTLQSNYLTACKIYGQRINTAVGSNPDIDINLPRDGRLLVGISIYQPYVDANDAPNYNLKINNTVFVQSTTTRALSVENLRSQLYYPLNVQLVGNDNISVSINGVTAAAFVDCVFYYI